MCSFNNSFFSAWLVPNSVQQWKRQTYFLFYLLSVPPPSFYHPCPGGSTGISHLDYCDWSPWFWFHPMAIPASAVSHMLLPLPICPQIRTLHWFFIAFRRKSKLLNMVCRSFMTWGMLPSLPICLDTPSSHFSPSKIHRPNY